MTDSVIEDGHVTPDAHHADLGNILRQLVVGVVGGGTGQGLEAVLVQQAFAVQRGEVFCGFAESGINGRVHNLAVNLTQMVGVLIAAAEESAVDIKKQIAFSHNNNPSDVYD